MQHIMDELAAEALMQQVEIVVSDKAMTMFGKVFRRMAGMGAHTERMEQQLGEVQASQSKLNDVIKGSGAAPGDGAASSAAPGGGSAAPAGSSAARAHGVLALGGATDVASGWSGGGRHWGSDDDEDDDWGSRRTNWPPTAW